MPETPLAHYEDLATRLNEVYPELAEDIARCCEQAFRRGFHHGLVATPGMEKEIREWRYDEGTPGKTFTERVAPPVHGSKEFIALGESKKRLRFEASSCGADVLWLLGNKEHS